MRLNKNVSHFDIAGEPSGPTLVKLTVHAVISYISFWPTYWQHKYFEAKAEM